METKAIRLSYGISSEIDIQTNLLYKVDSIALDAIEKEAIPGCQIMALKDGHVFYQKNFGHHTYNKQYSVQDSDVYDLASIASK